MPISVFWVFLLGLTLTLSSCKKTAEEDAEQTPNVESAREKAPLLIEDALAPPHPAPQAQESPQTDPSDSISNILSADLSPGETSSRLLSLLSNTPADDKSFLLQIAGNHCPDAEYWRMLPFLLDRAQTEDCREELIRDVLRRPDAIRLRPLYRLALDTTHPLSTEAREYLFSYLQDVPENDFNALARAVDKAEKENP